jgi:hypothetical protein
LDVWKDNIEIDLKKKECGMTWDTFIWLRIRKSEVPFGKW